MGNPIRARRGVLLIFPRFLGHSDQRRSWQSTLGPSRLFQPTELSFPPPAI